MPDPKNWYVNLPTAGDAEQGPAVQLVARRNPNAVRKAGGGAKRVKWKLEHDAVAKHGQFTSFTPALADAETAEGDDQSFKNTLNLPPTGGVTYTVKATKTSWSQNVNLEQKYLSWRKLWFTLNYMNADCLATFNLAEPAIKTALVAAGIELVAAEKVAAHGGVDEAVTIRKSDDIALQSRNQGAISHPPHHFRVQLVRDIAEEIEGPRLSGAATADAGDLHFQAEAQKLVIQTRKKQDGVTKGFKVTSLTLDPSVDNLPLAARTVARESDSTFTLQLTAEQYAAAHGARSVLVRGKLKGHHAQVKWVEPKAAFAKSNTVDRQLESDSVPKDPWKAWVANGFIHVKASDGWRFGEVQAQPAIRLLVRGPAVAAQGGAVGSVDPTELKIDLARFEGADAHFRGAAQNKLFLSGLKVRMLKADAGDEVEADFAVGGEDDEAGKSVTFIDGHKLRVATSMKLAAAPATAVSLSALGAKIALTPEERAAVAQSPAAGGATANLKFEVALAGVERFRPALDALVAGWAVRVELGYAYTKSLGGYYSDGGDKRTFVLTCIRLTADEAEATTHKRLRNAFLHELAHVFKLVKATEDTTSKVAGADKNPLWFEDNGGTGPHCSYTLTKTPGAYTTTDPQPNGKKLCLMFHSIVTDRDMEFCPTCLGQLQRAEIKVPGGV